MVALYCRAAAYLAQTLAAFPAGHHVLAAEAWPQFRRAMASASVAVVVLPRLVAQDLRALRALRAPRLARWLVPVVLVTSSEPDNARYLKDVTVAEVVWLDEADRELWPAVRRAANGHGSPRTRLADEIRMNERLPLQLRRALEYACRSERPITSIVALARAVGCGRSTLGRQWRRVVGTGRDRRLEDFLDWILLARAVERKAPDRSWEQVADNLRLYKSVLARVARRLTGHTLGDLNRDGSLVFAALLRLPWLDRLRGGEAGSGDPSSFAT